MAEVERRQFRGSQMILGASLAGAIGLAGLLIGSLSGPRHALLAYLMAWSYAVSIAVGALVFLAAGHAMNASWVAIVRRLCHAITSSLPLLLIGVLPILLGAEEIYPWLHASPTLPEHELHQLQHKSAYLNLPMFALRSLGYFLVWMVAAEMLQYWSLRREARKAAGSEQGDESSGQRERKLSCAALPFVGIAITFAAFDWLMSLQPLWLSTIFGLYVFAGGFLTALALMTIMAHASVRSGALARELSGSHFHAMGRLLLAFTAFWAYCGYFQAMLIRIADLPHEVTFFLRRMESGWQYVAFTLILGHFVLPFAVLLPRSWKRVPAIMAGVSAWLWLMGLVDVYWLVMPVDNGHGPVPDWVELSAVCCVFGFIVAFAAWRLRGHSLLAEGDPALEAGLAYESGY